MKTYLFLLFSIVLNVSVFAQDETYAIEKLFTQDETYVIEKVLDVPYKTQPTSVTCQSACLKMVAMYLQNNPFYENEGSEKSIFEIWEEINTGWERPVRKKNAWANFEWWLNENFSATLFHIKKTKDEREAEAYLKSNIDNEFPVILSTNHGRTKGHIILVVGYSIDTSTGETKFVCHDPYGEFHPELQSKYYGNDRYHSGQTNLDESEEGVGKNICLTIDAIKRIRPDKHHENVFVMIGVM